MCVGVFLTRRMCVFIPAVLDAKQSLTTRWLGPLWDAAGLLGDCLRVLDLYSGLTEQILKPQHLGCGVLWEICSGNVLAQMIHPISEHFWYFKSLQSRLLSEYGPTISPQLIIEDYY